VPTPASAEVIVGPAASPRTYTEVTEPQQRRTATLLAKARERDTAAGDALDLLDHARGGLLAGADQAGTPGAAADLSGLDLAAQGSATALSRSCPTRRPAACRRGDTIGRTMSREQLAAAG